MRSARAHRDDGFTVVELVIATAIMFFAMTALLGLLGASTSMTASAKSRSLLTNAIAAELEKIRALPIEQVGYDTASPGKIPHSMTVYPEGSSNPDVVITLTFTVVDRTTYNNTKEVTIDGELRRRGFPTVRQSSFTAIRDRIGGHTTYAGNNGPIIEFVEAETTPEGSVLNFQKIGGTQTDIKITARATSDSGNNITRFEYTVDTISGQQPLKETNTIYFGETSMYDVPTPSPEEIYEFTPWNTDQKNPSNQSEIQDGIRTVTIIAYDDLNRASAPVRRWFLVDNDPPEAAPAVSLVCAQNADLSQTLTLGWDAVYDGTEPAHAYNYDLYEWRNVSGTTNDWQLVTLGAGVKTASARPLGWYRLSVEALSPLGSPGPLGTSPVVMSRPVLSGTHDVLRAKVNNSTDKWTYTSRFSLPSPGVYFASAGASIVLERTGGGVTGTTNIDITSAVLAKWNAGLAYTHTDVVAQSIGKNATPVPPDYRLKVVINPGTGLQTQYSNYAKGIIPNIKNTDPAATGLAYAVRW